MGDLTSKPRIFAKNTMQKLTLIFFTLFVIACQKEIKLPPSKIPQKVVINCLFSPATTWVVYVSLSTDAASATPPIVENAKVMIFEEGQFMETLTYTEKGKYVGFSAPKTGGKYSIKVEVPHFETVSATDSVPSAVKIHDAFFTARKVTNTDGTPLFQQTILFTDPLLARNFYQIYGAFDYYLVTDTWGVFYPFYEVSSYCMNDEALNGQTVSFVTTTSITERPAVITDSLVGTRTIYLHSLSPTHFKFVKTGHIQAVNNFQGIDTWTSALAITEPQNLYSNIQGGLGIFAAYNSDTMITRYIE